MRWGVAVGWVVVFLGGAAVAQPADGDDAAPKKQAQALVDEAFRHIDAGDHAKAVGVFRRAYDTYPSEKILLNIGTSLMQIGDRAGAAQTYQMYLDHALASPERRDQVARELSRLESLVGKLQIEANVLDAQIQLDGKPIQAGVVYVEPGRHTLTAARSGFEPATRTIDAKAGEHKTVGLELKERGAKAEPPPVVSHPIETPGADAPRPSRAPWIVFGTGAVVTATGAGLLIWALVDKRAVENAGEGTEFSEIEGRFDRVEPVSTAGVAAIAVGAAAMVGGLSWALLRDGQEPAAEPALTVGLGYVGLRGQF